MYTGPVPALSRKRQRNSGFAVVPVTNFLQMLLSPSLDSPMLLSQRRTHGRYWLDYIGLVGLLTLVSQTLLSRTRWSLSRYCPKHRSTEAAVRLIGLTVAAHEHRIRQRTITHLGPLTLLSRTPNSQILGYEHRFCTRSSHAHKTRKRLFHVRWSTKRRSHNHRTLRRTWSCTFTNTAVTNSGLAYAPVYEHKPRKLSSYERRTRKRLVTHSGHKNGRVTYAGLPEAAVTTLDSLTLLVGFNWIGWIDYIGFTNAAISLVGYWLDYIRLVGLITLVSQTLLSRWLAIGWLSWDWLD